jgi:sortase A
MAHLPRSATRLTLVGAGVVLLGGSGVAAVTSGLQPGSARGSAERPHAVAVVPAPDQYNPTTAPVHGAAPQQLRIPAVGVDAAVEPVGVTAGYAMATPTRTEDVGWYQLGSAPGDAGDAVIDGHLDTPSGGPAVFARLASLRPGDGISVTAGGREYRYSVASVTSVPYEWRPDGLYSTEGPPRLTLITCAGAWDASKSIYRERLVVEASPATN